MRKLKFIRYITDLLSGRMHGAINGLDKRYQKGFKAMSRKVQAQEEELGRRIDRVEQAAQRAASNTRDILEQLRSKNEETTDIDLEDEISRLDNVATQLEGIGGNAAGTAGSTTSTQSGAGTAAGGGPANEPPTPSDLTPGGPNAGSAGSGTGASGGNLEGDQTVGDANATVVSAGQAAQSDSTGSAESPSATGGPGIPLGDDPKS